MTSCHRCKYGDTYADIMFLRELGYCGSSKALAFALGTGAPRQTNINRDGNCPYYEPRPPSLWTRMFGKKVPR